MKRWKFQAYVWREYPYGLAEWRRRLWIDHVLRTSRVWTDHPRRVVFAREVLQSLPYAVRRFTRGGDAWY